MRYVLIFCYFIIGSLCIVTPANAQVKTTRTEAAQLKKVLLNYHLEPRQFNDVLSERIFRLLMAEINPDGMYFTRSEVEKLSAYKLKLDDEINGTGWSFFPMLLETYKQSLIRCEANITAASSRAVDINQSIDVSDSSYAISDADQQERWSRMIVAEVLVDLADLRPTYARLPEREFIAKHEPIVRARVSLRAQRAIRRILNHAEGYENYMSGVFLGCISHAFDAHSAYLSPTQMENFMSVLSSEGFYFGISLNENANGEFVISNLKPGGPAWKSGEVHNGDVIEKLRWAGSEWIDPAGMDENEIDEILAESNHNILELTLRNVTTGSHVVQLKKEKLDSEDNIVKSFVLAGEKRIGYISLPDFYSEWGDQEGAKCANDVAKEIFKLKRENIQALILDVRFNGGGSLNEAVAMAGTFVDAGPMGIIKTKGEEPVTIKDMNRGTVYDGPLVILVNRLSASASEFLAAALQDHSRAIIVGTRTYGKATGQEMYSLTPGKPEINYTKLTGTGWGFSTITTSRIYRINGKSLQKNGVAADITLPDFYDLDLYSENALPFALNPDSCSKKTYYTKLRSIPVSVLREKSLSRVNADSLFGSVRNYMRILESEGDRDRIEWKSLTRDAFIQHDQFESLTKKLNAKLPAFSITVPGHELEQQLWNEYDHAVYDAWIKNISKDISLEEAFHILCDYIDTLNP